MSVYFTHNQYLKTAEEDYEAAEVLYGHKYYDQTASLCSIAMTKYLKAVLEAILPIGEATAWYMTEDKLKILGKIREHIADFPVTEQECRWMDSVYGKANCTDGIHIIMPKSTAVEALHVLSGVQKQAKHYDKEATAKNHYKNA